MAMLGPVISQSSATTNDFHDFLAKVNLDQSSNRLERELNVGSVSQLRQLNDLSNLTGMGVTKKEMGNLKRQLKKQDNQGTFSKFRKSKLEKPISEEDQHRTTVTKLSSPITKSDGSCSIRNENTWTTISRSDASQPIERNCKCLILNDQERGQAFAEKRGSALKRSISAAADHVTRDHIHCHQHQQQHLHQNQTNCTCGKRLAQWHGSEPLNDCSKRLSLRCDDQEQRTISGQIQCDHSAKSSATMQEVLTALGGHSYAKPELSASTDKSPLLELESSAFSGSKNTFDNVAAVENMSISRNPSETRLPDPQLEPSSVALSGISEGDKHSATSKHLDGRRKKWFPTLRIKIPESNENGPKLNIKKLSSAEERRIDEAVELAGTFARMGISDHSASTPQTPGASSKESKESLNSDSPTVHFRFNIFKTRKEEKKTFVDTLASNLTDPNSVLTPEALDTYEKLISTSTFVEEEGKGKSQPSVKPSTRQMHRFNVRVQKLRNHYQRSTLSESDKVQIPNNELKKKGYAEKRNEMRLTTDAWVPFRLARFGSTGVTVRNLKSPLERKLFDLFEKSPLNTNKSENKARPKSYQADDRMGNAYPLTMPLENHPMETLNDFVRDQDHFLSMGEPQKSRSIPPAPLSDPPPALPPRIPLRQSTVGLNTKSHQRHLHLPKRGCSPDKKRSFSERVVARTKANVGHENMYDVPRREVSSTSLEESFSSDLHSPIGFKELLDTTHDSDDSVFNQSPKSPVPMVSQKTVHASVGFKNLWSQGPSATSSGAANKPWQRRSLSVKDVEVKAEDLGISNKNDPFWVRQVSFDLTESHSESDLMREALTPIPGRYETSDCISYEDLMEFALDGPQQNTRSVNDGDSAICDEIRVLRKMFSNDVTIDDCMGALVETSWDVHKAVKLIKLKQLLGTGLGSQERCKEALMACHWNVDEAASHLLAAQQP